MTNTLVVDMAWMVVISAEGVSAGCEVLSVNTWTLDSGVDFGPGLGDSASGSMDAPELRVVVE